jgi:outer membrane protein OmpA-like peptidoglycan-associated protein
MTASGLWSRSEDAGVFGIVTARWPAPLRYAAAAGLLLVGVGALVVIDMVLLPRYLAVSPKAVSQPKPVSQRPAAVSLVPRAVPLANSEPQAKEPSLARGSGPVAPSAPAAPLARVPLTFPRLLFAMKDARITPTAERILGQVATALKKDPRLHVVLNGHTDDLGTVAYNAVLSVQRAQHSGQWLERNGVAAERIEMHGFGATRPLEHGLSLRARAHNRRVEIDLR